jgi:hypothetical protein
VFAFASVLASPEGTELLELFESMTPVKFKTFRWLYVQ